MMRQVITLKCDCGVEVRSTELGRDEDDLWIWTWHPSRYSRTTVRCDCANGTVNVPDGVEATVTAPPRKASCLDKFRYKEDPR